MVGPVAGYDIAGERLMNTNARRPLANARTEYHQPPVTLGDCDVQLRQPRLIEDWRGGLNVLFAYTLETKLQSAPLNVLITVSYTLAPLSSSVHVLAKYPSCCDLYQAETGRPSAAATSRDAGCKVRHQAQSDIY